MLQKLLYNPISMQSFHLMTVDRVVQNHTPVYKVSIGSLLLLEYVARVQIRAPILSAGPSLAAFPLPIPNAVRNRQDGPTRLDINIYIYI